MAKRDAPQGTQAILRAIRLLKAFTESRFEMSLHELATQTGLSKTTAHRLLAALESEGLIARGTTRSTYRLGATLMALGVQALRTSDLRLAAKPSLDALARATGETVTLEVLSDDQMLILDEASGRHLVSVLAEIGTRWPLHATSTGKALLAELPESQARALLKFPLARFTASTLTEWEELLRDLFRVRQQGYATAAEELEIGFTAVGAAFWGPMGNVLGAISVGGPSSRLGTERLRSLGSEVRATADAISERLGFDLRRRR